MMIPCAFVLLPALFDLIEQATRARNQMAQLSRKMDLPVATTLTPQHRPHHRRRHRRRLPHPLHQAKPNVPTNTRLICGVSWQLML